ncbi:MAG: helix-turn-helix domain-containing protein [Chloroflexi bacterium]|nr:MAG: helix-turn-helix domain-containing protein [Chloroflexota bacterium]
MHGLAEPAQSLFAGAVARWTFPTQRITQQNAAQPSVCRRVPTVIFRLRSALDLLKPKTLLPLADLLLVNAAVLAGLWLWTVRDHFRHFDARFVLTRTHWFLAISAVWLLLAIIQDFYQKRTTREVLPSMTSLFGITALLMVLYFAVYFFAPRNNTLPRGVVLSIAGASFLFVGTWRLGYIALTSGLSREQLLLRGSRQAEALADAGSARQPGDGQSMPLLQSEVLSAQEVAERLKVSQATVWRWCQSGKLPAFRVGQQWRIRAVDLQRMMSADQPPD